MNKLIALLFFFAIAGPAAGQILIGDLAGANEVPAGSGDPDGSGQAAVWVVDGRIHFDIVVQDVDPLTLAHIHQGAAGTNGPVVVDFTAQINAAGDRVLGSIPIDPELADDILADPNGFYFNVHNAVFPAGAIRSQLSRQSTTRLFTLPLATNEVPDPGPVGGTGTAIVRLGGFAAAYDFSAEGIEIPPILHHIHQGPAGVNGPVVVDFDPVEWAGTTADGGTARGIVVSDPAVLSAVVDNPEGHYVNIHTTDFPAGAIRGQLGLLPGEARQIPANAPWALMLMVVLMIGAAFAVRRAFA